MPDNFSERYGPWAVVAGASDGIGASVARLLGARGVNVVLVARRSATLEEVAATVASETRTVVLDLSEPQAATALAEATADLDVGLFVYNAGGDPNASLFLEKDVGPGRTSSCATASPSSARPITSPAPCGSEAMAASSW